MWFTFFLAMLTAAALLFAPGYLFLRGFNCDSVAAICFAPLPSVFFVSSLSIAYGSLGIFASPLSLMTPILIICMCVFLVGRHLHVQTKEKRGSSRQSGLLLLPYVIFGFTVTAIVFIKNLDGADSFFQAYDNWMHLGMVRSFLDSGNYSSFNSLYAAGDINPFFSGASFYPSAWHAVVALVASSLDAPITLATNAVNSVLIAFVFPLSIKCLLEYLFSGKYMIVLFGSIASVGIVSCPWDFVAFGPLYPNLLSMSLVPASSVAFMKLIDEFQVSSRSRRFLYLLGFVGCCVSVALSQPNGIFSMAVFLAPYLVNKAYLLAAESDCRFRVKPLVAAVATAFGIALIWAICYFLPSFRGVVQFNWPATTSIFQAWVDVTLLGLASRPVQLVFVVFCFIGAVEIWKSRTNRWILVPVLFSGFSYILCVSTEGVLKHFTAGFWYTDPHRIAALVGLCAIPLAAVGLYRVFEKLCFVTGSSADARHNASVARKARMVAFLAVVFLMLLAPCFEIRGIGSMDTPFGQLTDEVSGQNDVNGSHVLTSEELAFSKRALEAVPEDALIINEPNDGSGFLYALFDADIYYRKFDLPALEDEKIESQIVRSKLTDYSSDSSVRDAVKKIGAQYVLLLDQGEDNGEDRQRFWSYYPQQWKGIEAINDSTPGFSVVLSQGDMRLYKIDE